MTETNDSWTTGSCFDLTSGQYATDEDELQSWCEADMKRRNDKLDAEFLERTIAFLKGYFVAAPNERVSEDKLCWEVKKHCRLKRYEEGIYTKASLYILEDDEEFIELWNGPSPDYEIRFSRMRN